jgi:DNA (cytosine-5)-methyltransferase 1
MAEKNPYDKSVAEFFAGIGLMRAGLEKNGWKTVIANDIDPVKRKLYLNHFTNSSDHFILDDIHNLSAKSIPNIDLATASFPCTDLSLAGRRAGLDGAHSSAFWGFVDILRIIENRPNFVLLENVAGFLTSHNGEDFKNALFALNNLGYAVDAFIINAAHFVPQSRVRLFIVGKQKEQEQIKIRHYLPDEQLRPSKLRDFIFDHPEINWDINYNLPDLPILESRLINIVEDIGKGSSIWWSKQRVDYLLNQTFDRHLKKINELKDLKTYSYLTAFRRVRNGKSMAEVRFDGIAGCLRTPKGGSARQILLKVGKGEVNIRLLTPRECARLMGIDDFKLSGTLNESLFGFGDAVCVPVISWIAENYLNPEFEKVLNRKKVEIEKYAKPA